MRSVHTVDSTHGHRPRMSPACLAPSGTVAGCGFVGPSVTHPPSCAPFAPRPLQALHRYYGRSDSHAVSRSSRVGLPASHTSPSRPFRLQPPSARPRRRFRTLPISATDSPLPHGSRLRHFHAGSPTAQAESSSSSYGLVVHLLLLPTPPRDDAVAVGYRPESADLKRTSTSLLMCAHRRTWGGRPCPPA